MIDLYPFIRPLLFKLSPECALKLSMLGLRLAPKIFCPQLKNDPIEVMGLTFLNRIGIAAGVDDNGDYFNVLGKLGVGFIEVGGVTPRPQAGNPLPRVFRLQADKSLINRKGFANKGVDYCVEQLKQRQYQGIIGVNIAKMKETPLANAYDDYEICYRKCHPVADFVTINISSPNTPQLRELQAENYLQDLLTKMKALQCQCQEETGRYVPLTVKISPDVSLEEMTQMANSIIESGMDGIICTNTTLSRDAVSNHVLAQETGGLSGEGLTELSRTKLQELNDIVQGRIPIISVGGICDGAEAKQRMKMGASLLQVYSGLVYQGPCLLEDISRQI